MTNFLSDFMHEALPFSWIDNTTAQPRHSNDSALDSDPMVNATDSHHQPFEEENPNLADASEDETCSPINTSGKSSKRVDISNDFCDLMQEALPSSLIDNTTAQPGHSNDFALNSDPMVNATDSHHRPIEEENPNVPDASRDETCSASSSSGKSSKRGDISNGFCDLLTWIKSTSPSGALAECSQNNAASVGITPIHPSEKELGDNSKECSDKLDALNGVFQLKTHSRLANTTESYVGNASNVETVGIPVLEADISDGLRACRIDNDLEYGSVRPHACEAKEFVNHYRESLECDPMHASNVTLTCELLSDVGIITQWSDDDIEEAESAPPIASGNELILDSTNPTEEMKPGEGFIVLDRSEVCPFYNGEGKIIPNKRKIGRAFYSKVFPTKNNTNPVGAELNIQMECSGNLLSLSRPSTPEEVEYSNSDWEIV
ncbi:uncharacterized protein LOC116203395 isoform X2 [Punica granatum]|uniref:Uncharacterized protein LOC116203395 isoform X2 n=1 Tax=Punica granatum TaxID=22663 RepID=A0A6P8DBT3_PUNGR|nr:uncharacterized protein LOC116203395 isoform X2 [Punica granatum]